MWAAPVMLPLLATAWKAFNCAKFITDSCQSNTNSVKVAQIKTGSKNPRCHKTARRLRLQAYDLAHAENYPDKIKSMNLDLYTARLQRVPNAIDGVRRFD